MEYANLFLSMGLRIGKRVAASLSILHSSFVAMLALGVLKILRIRFLVLPMPLFNEGFMVHPVRHR